MHDGHGATIKDIAIAEGVTVPFVSRFLRLAYLAPGVLARLLLHRKPCALPLDRPAATALVPWEEQADTVFDGRTAHMVCGQERNECTEREYGFTLGGFPWPRSSCRRFGWKPYYTSPINLGRRSPCQECHSSSANPAGTRGADYCLNRLNPRPSGIFPPYRFQ